MCTTWREDTNTQTSLHIQLNLRRDSTHKKGLVAYQITFDEVNNCVTTNVSDEKRSSAAQSGTSQIEESKLQRGKQLTEALGLIWSL